MKKTILILLLVSTTSTLFAKCCCKGYIKKQIKAVDTHFKQINNANIDEVKLLTEKFNILNNGYLKDLVVDFESEILDTKEHLEKFGLGNIGGLYRAEARTAQNLYLGDLEHNYSIQKLNEIIEINNAKSSLEAKIKAIELEKKIVECKEEILVTDLNAL